MAPSRVSTSNERIKELIEDMGMSQIQFCDRTGIKASALSNYLNGNRIPRQDAIMKIADAFNISSAWLMGYDVPANIHDYTSINHMVTPDKRLDQLIIYGHPDRATAYVQLLEAADGCEISQLTPIIEALKAMSKENERKGKDFW